MTRHEVDGLRCNHFRRDRQVAFVFTIRIVNHNDHSPSLQLANGNFDTRERAYIFIAFILFKAEGVPEPFLFGLQVWQGVYGWRCFAPDLSDDFDTSLTQGARLFGVVSKQPHSLDAKFMQDGSRQAKISAILRELQCMMGLDGIESTVRRCVSLQLAHEADAASLLIFVDHQAASFFSNGAHGYLKLLFAVAPKRTKDLAGNALRMNPHQRRGIRQIPQEQYERSFDSLFAARNVPLKGEGSKHTQPGRYLSGDNSSECSGLCDWYHG